MSKCSGVTKAGEQCKKWATSGTKWCSLHSDQKLILLQPDQSADTPGSLPLEILGIILRKSQIPEIARFHLTCKSVYFYVRDRWFAANPQFAVLLNQLGRPAPGTATHEWSTTFLCRSSRDLVVVVKDRYRPYGIPVKEVAKSTLVPLITRVVGYTGLMETMKRIETHRLEPDPLFTLTDPDQVAHAVHQYANNRTVNFFVSRILTRLNDTTKPHTIAHYVGSDRVNWLKCPEIVKQIAAKVRLVYPNLHLVVAGSRIVYSLSGPLPQF